MARVRRPTVVCDKAHRGADVDAVGTVEVIIDGQRRKVDLCGPHLGEFKRAVGPWFRAGHVVAGSERRGHPGTSTAARRRSAAVREWAAAHGFDLPARGRIPKSVNEAFDAAGER